MAEQPPPNNSQHSKGPERNESAGIDRQCLDFCPICRSADVIRATLPPEFHEHWQAVQREAALALRAALDHYISHLESESEGSSPVEDIPIG
jgi:hypothetical protein